MQEEANHMEQTMPTELLGMVCEILESDTVYRDALIHNIKALYDGAKSARKNSELRHDVKTILLELAEIKALIKTRAQESS